MTASAHDVRYNQALDFLLGRINYERIPSVPYRAGQYRLDRMRELLSRLGNPHARLNIVHVAGTKGKGSTACFLSSICTAAGYRTGAFTSPHLHRLEERIAIDGRACQPQEFVQLVEQLRPVVEAMDREIQDSVADGPARGPTYFELTTALALLHFAQQDVALAILEVGMGGRLDSTNVCQPLCTAITSISFDHTRQLGETLPAIAAEKAGIIKSGVPVVSGVVDEQARTVIAKLAQQHNAPVVQVGIDFGYRYHPPGGKGMTDGDAEMDYLPHCETAGPPLSRLTLGMLGRHQAANAASALAIVARLSQLGWQFSESAIREGVRRAQLAPRIEIVQRRPTVIVDAAHNAASVQALADVLQESFHATHRLLVFASTEGKDLRAMLATLLPMFDRVIFTRYLNNPRGVAPETLQEISAEIIQKIHSNPPAIQRICQRPELAWTLAQQMAKPDWLLCVTGSFFIAAEMREIIRGQAESRQMER